MRCSGLGGCECCRHNWEASRIDSKAVVKESADKTLQVKLFGRGNARAIVDSGRLG